MNNVRSCYEKSNKPTHRKQHWLCYKILSSVYAQCDNLAKKANELIEGTHLADYIVDYISCEYSPSVGLVFILELNDGEVPHNIRCSSFFELFKGDIDEITIQDLKRLSL